jgi:GNAT superfamily N-acetyltransferase
MSPTFPLDTKLKDGSPIQLVLANERDVEPLRRLYRVIVEEGNSYPHDRFPDQEDFMDYWLRGKSTVAAYVPDRANAAGMVGAFYLKSNWPGRAKHVANAGFIVAPDWRNKGLGGLLGATMLAYAKQLGYRSVIFDRARIIHEDFYCNRRYAATTGLTAGGLAAQSVNMLFQVCFPPSRLHAPVSPGVSAVSSRTLVNIAASVFRKYGCAPSLGQIWLRRNWV